jgi:NTE family protein
MAGIDGQGRLAIVFSGGGARGAYQAGVYSVLARDERFERPEILVGTSAGAINAALIAAGKSPDDLIEFWLRLGDGPPVSVNRKLDNSVLWGGLRAGWDLIRHPPSLRSARTLMSRSVKHLWPPLPTTPIPIVLEWLLTQRFGLVDEFLNGFSQTAIGDTTGLRTRLRDALGGDEVKTGLGFGVNAVDAIRHRVVRFVNAPPQTPSKEEYVEGPITVDMILASCAIPILFPAVPITIAGVKRFFWDGGVLSNTPMAPAVAMGAERILPILSTERVRAGARLENLGDALEHLADMLLENSYNADRKLLLHRNRDPAPEQRSAMLYTPIRPDGGVFDTGSFLYFERSELERMVTAGQAAATAWLRNVQLDDLERESP